ncbi:hypothetical protein ACN26Y_08645 [Micromonospora sp. WMMD558]|uniref:WXG100-like domain-containing protein n=1 Tax=unclassified Micromonospora TaxID=2617518 RepID=UPI0012B4AD89|nr:hypothetical protein [Micromonospora sp. WMMC415]QGN46335.1 hypothetical protein GKC29_05450 [Micromonospora sp. WMMC415]
MGMQLPPELAEALGWVGFTWPTADEELLFEASQMWFAFAGRLRTAVGDAEKGSSQVFGVNSGDDVRAFEQAWRGEEGPPRRMEDGAQAAELIGMALLVMAIITLTQKILVIIQLTILVVQVAIALAAAAPSLGASLAQIPVAIGVARMAIQRIVKEVVERVVKEIIPQLLKRAKRLLRRFTGKGRGPGGAPKPGIPGPHMTPRYHNTKPMLDKYRNEHLPGGFFPTPVRRLTPEQLEEHRVFFDGDGILRSAKDGTPYDTSASSTVFSGNGQAIFVMDRNGNIYASTYQKVGDFHHSTLGNGQPVAAAGELVVRDGRVQLATARSGHYQPDASHMANLDAEFKRNGLGDVPIHSWDGSRIF